VNAEAPKFRDFSSEEGKAWMSLLSEGEVRFNHVISEEAKYLVLPF
jgi:hypothetical protein